MCTVALCSSSLFGHTPAPSLRNVSNHMPVQQYSAVTHVDLCVQAIQRLAGTHSVEAMVWNSPAGRFLHPQVSCLCLTCSDETNLLLV